ncbi:MAG: glycine--tRNA ligase subunit beta [Holosporales bacterium]|jgi:glycyl-tRNA synthetase beta chain|nr:glycine--tRNA ligase subunit beta [Holosporales bacterium]
MQKEFLLEILSEEIPSRFQRDALSNASTVFTKILNDYCTKFSSVSTYISSRRLTVVVKYLIKKFDNVPEEKRGPKVSAPERSIEGFLNANGKQRDDLIVRNGYYYLQVETHSDDIEDLIPLFIRDFILKMPWPKSMRWYISSQKMLSAFWVRPIRSILCIYDDGPVNAFIESVGLTTCDYTYGHRFLAPDPIKVSDFEDYENKLKENYVLIDYRKKMSFIDRELLQRVAAIGLHLSNDDELLEESTGLVEYPFVHVGTIDTEFMKLPAPVLSTAMKVHQKYFSVEYPELILAPFFGTVTNVPGTDVMYEGMNRVLKARLSDAMFFYKADIDVTLEAFAQRLSNIVFHEKLGSMAQKVDRMMSIANSKDEHRAVALCKADLLSQLVGEFPELQGTMGGIYAKIQDESANVATAIREHYKPTGANDVLPDSFTGSRISFFDKLDTLVGFLGMGITPSGSKDPFALRRSALCIIRLLCDSEFNVLEEDNLSWYVTTLINAFSDQGVALYPDTLENVHKFLISRLKIYMTDKLMINQEVMESVISSFDSVDFSYKDAVAKSKKLSKSLARAGFGTIKEALKRTLGIIGKETPENFDENIDFLDSHMKNLKNHIEVCQNIHDESEFFSSIVRISEIVLETCENVLINDPDPDLRDKNASLLCRFVKLVQDNIGIV